ncbi:SusC/RagA family TonB-linked outer membrane protein [Mucilaginibacter auburnensis]|uniref:TonB-linked SusC/RagA family outer membrane protein n=1 Tax=Mucilaginibacter auburnensis TaxID=1457233 RepID=A0A2H9VTZ5_9SPHI|nr:SusC/RagA family TonB-linked outer membrane protein [Mucilaginibacter auburnensis]PJJ84303.1 TonB-linked SusC/RagA family outer membrane protein [Mucilaginibacter auburnensis]
MKKRRGTPSYNSIVTGVFAVLLCASSAQAENNTNSNAAALGPLAKLAAANVLVKPVPAKTVTGKVVDSKGEALIGVSIAEQGTTKGVVTDADGNYSISVEGNNSILVFTYIGYETQSQTVGARTVINVTLQNKSSNLEEVVVTALGIKRESKKLGYAATTANVEEIQQNRTTNVMSSLEGKVAGLNISPPAAGPGSSTRIRLRGQAAFNGATNSPLIVVNGLPMDQGEQSVGPNNTTDRGDALQQINQDDIESFTVLKGSTAAALYGSRAANGAIIITTKSGAKNTKFGVEFTSNFAADQVLDYNRYQMIYGNGVWDATKLSGRKPASQGESVTYGAQTWGAKYDGSPVTYFDGSTGTYSPNPNRITEYYRTGTSFNNALALSGGNASTSFRLSYSNQDAKGISPVNDYHKKIANLGLNSKITEKLTLTFNLNYTNEVNNNPPQVGFQGAGAPNFLYRMSPAIPLRLFRDSAVNPATLSEAQTSGFQTTLLNPYYSNPRQFLVRKADRFLSTTTARYDFFKFLYLQGRVAFDYNSALNEGNTPHGVGASNLLQNGTGPAYSGSYNVNTNWQRNMNYDFLLGTNNQRFGDFSAELTLGGNIRDDRGSGVRASTANGLIVKDLYSIENGVQKNVNYDFNRQQVNSLYGVADFGYKSFLYLTITDRVDWFSVLTPPSFIISNPKNSVNYPSVSGSFVFSELLPNVKWLNYGKLRASYARTGSAGGINNFSSQLGYSLNANPFTANGYSYTLGNFNANYPNPFVTPFDVIEKEIGLEVKTLNSRLNFDVAVYHKSSQNQILNTPLSAASGFTTRPVNIGNLRNKGIEVLIDGTPIKTANFTWNTSMNAAYNESLVLKLADGQTTQVVNAFNANGNEFLGKLSYVVGMAMNQLQSPTYLRNAAGQILVTKDGALLATKYDVNFGQADPKWTGGWNNTFRYKRLSLLVHIDYKFGGKMFSSTALNGLRQGLTQASLVGREGGVKFPGIIYDPTGGPGGTPGPTNGTNNADRAVGVVPSTFYADYRTLQIADPFVFKSDFVKLRNITVSYDFSDMLKNVKYIKGISVSAFVRNVAILHKDVPDIDPEAMASTGDSRLGYEQSTIPTTRTFGLNLNVKF